METRGRLPAEQSVPPVLACSSAGVSLCDARSFLAFAMYLAFACALFGRTLFGHFSTNYIGVGPDPGLHIWFLVWWPHAIANGLNPVLTHAIWAPSGFNLAWQTSIPLASMLASPLTLTIGPIAAYNTLCLLALPAAGWSAFLLCRYLSRDYWASVMGGYIFGFSAFEVGHLLFGDISLLLVFPVPLAVYFALRRIAGEMTERRFAVMLTVLLVAQILLSLELFATMTMFGAFTILLGWSFATHDQRKRLLQLLKPIALSYIVASTLASPLLYYFFFVDFTSTPIWPPSFFSADLLNFFVPTQSNELGRLPFLTNISRTFSGGSIGESGAYLSLPLMVIVVFYARQRWCERLCRLLVEFLIIVCALSLGPVLHIAGRIIPSYLPWELFTRLPVVDDVLVVRFSMYAFLDLALIASLWLSSANTRQSLRLAFVVLVVIFTLPNLSASFWVRMADTPSFFRTGVYRHYLLKGETVLILPYGDDGNCMLWQAQTDMYFSMPQGMAPPVRLYERRRWPIVSAFLRRSYTPEASEQLKAFLAAHHVDSVVITDDHFRTWRSLFSTLGVSPIRVADVWLYKLHPDGEHDWQRGLLEMRARFDRQRLSTLISAANEYLLKGGNLASISTAKVVDFKLISPSLLFGPAVVSFEPTLSGNSMSNTEPWLAYGLWLSPWPSDRVSVGEFAWYPAVAPLIEKLRGIASKICFPYPSRLAANATPPESQADGFLLMTFTRDQLARATELLKVSATPAAKKPSPEDTSATPPAPSIRE
jgi:hypothetical protein